jgi:hypothetical protein
MQEEGREEGGGGREKMEGEGRLWLLHWLWLAAG